MLIPAPIARLVLIILLVVGAPFVFLGLYEIAGTNSTLGHSERVTGTVVDNSYSTTQDGTTVSGAYYPVVEYTTAAGETLRFTDGAGSLPPDYAVGDPVPVTYDPAGVEKPLLATWKRLWFVPTLFIIIGLVPVSVFALVLAVAALTARLRPPPTPSRRPY